MNDGTNHPVFRNPLGTEDYENNAETTPLLDEKQFQNVLITKDGEPDCIPLSTNINLKCKKHMLYFPMDFGELTILERNPFCRIRKLLEVSFSLTKRTEHVR